MGDEHMKRARAAALLAGLALAASLCVSDVSAQTESANAEDGKPASEAPAEMVSSPNVPLGANLTPPLGALPLGPAIISGPGTGQPGSSTVSVAPGTMTTGEARQGIKAVRAPDAVPAPVADAAPEPVTGTTVDETSEPVVADMAVATASDLDADNYPDALEVESGLDPSNPDTDGDGVADGDEGTLYGTNPLVGDTDGDGLADGEELFATRTDPVVWDTDGDGVSDGEEVAAGTDPLDPASVPVG